MTAAKAGRLHGLLGQHADVLLHAQQVAARLLAAQLGHLGHREDQHVLGLVGGVVALLQRLLQLAVGRQQVAGQPVGALLGLLEPQGQPHAAQQDRRRGWRAAPGRRRPARDPQLDRRPLRVGRQQDAA